MVVEQSCQIQTLLSLLNAVLGKHAGRVLEYQQYEMLLIFCLVWSLGGLIQENCRGSFDGFLRGLTHLMPTKVSERSIEG
jgi:Dynein heavy chain AAA lid domain